MAYMDMDLATDLAALPTLADAIARDGHDVAFGSRLKRGAEVIGRSPKREFISRCYSLVFRSMFLTGFVDAQCGFKAVSRRVVEQVLPSSKTQGGSSIPSFSSCARRTGTACVRYPCAG